MTSTARPATAPTERVIDFWPSFWPQDEPWAKRYPGAWAMRLSGSAPCLICRNPGYVVPCPSERLTFADFDTPLEPPTIQTESTCPGHEYAVRKYLAHRFAPRFAAEVDAEATEVWRLR